MALKDIKPEQMGDKSVYRKNKMAKQVLVEPIFRQQPHETDVEYKLFLIYRDQPWEQRSYRMTTAIALDTHPNNVHFPHSQIQIAAARWQWVNRVHAYDLFIQESSSEREEKVRLQMKSDIEMICMRLARKIKAIEAISDANELETPEMKRDMAIVQALVGKENAGTFILNAYKTIVGQKLQVAGMKKIPELTWGDVKPLEDKAA